MCEEALVVRCEKRLFQAPPSLRVGLHEALVRYQLEQDTFVLLREGQEEEVDGEEGEEWSEKKGGRGEGRMRGREGGSARGREGRQRKALPIWGVAAPGREMDEGGSEGAGRAGA